MSCGLKTIIPSNPHDAKGLLIAAIEDDDPVIFLEPKRLYNGPFDGHHERPDRAVEQERTRRTAGRLLYRADRQGGDSARGRGRYRAGLRHDGACRGGGGQTISASMPRSSICERWCRSISKPSRHRSPRPAGSSSCTRPRGRRVSARSWRREVQERCFYHLEAPILRVTGWDTPYPHAQEWDYFPGPDRVGRALRQVIGSVKWAFVSSSCLTSAKALPKPRSSNGTSWSATRSSKTRSWRP